jgi:aspartyl-tRNA(Asn)/glutamyl-tRNA(Gln) amidotransferase subunit C
MSVTREEIQRMAALAALDVDERALPELTAQISRILDYVDQLKNAPASSEPGVAVGMSAQSCPLREDEVRPDPLARTPAIGRIEDA